MDSHIERELVKICPLMFDTPEARTHNPVTFKRLQPTKQDQWLKRGITTTIHVSFNGDGPVTSCIGEVNIRQDDELTKSLTSKRYYCHRHWWIGLEDKLLHRWER